MHEMDRSKTYVFWFLGICGISLFLIVATLLGNRMPLRGFSLSTENNFAALWSSMLLLLAAVHAFDGWVAHRSSQRSIALAWLFISFVIAALSFDETGSFHERVPSIGDLSEWWTLLPFAVFFGGLVAYAFIVLFLSEEFHREAVLIAAAIALFASVALQEYIQHEVDWDGVRGFRLILEEGTELLGMVLLVKAAMINTRGILSVGAPASFPVFELITVYRIPIVIASLLFAPLIALFTVSLPPNDYDHGFPADWPAAALFFLATFATIRPYLAARVTLGYPAWLMAALCAAGCVGTAVLKENSPSAVPIMVGLILAACLIWRLDSRLSQRQFLPVAGAVLLFSGFAWVYRESDLITYWLIQYVALAMFFVNSAVNTQEIGSDSSNGGSQIVMPS